MTDEPAPAVDRHVRIYEVGPRDGLQNEPTPIPTEAKARFIELLVAAGLREIEATSFVSPRAIPQLADADELLPPPARGHRRPLPGARAEPAGHDPGGGGRSRRAGGLHGHDRRLHRAQHRHVGRRFARCVRPGPRAGRRARLVAPSVRLDGLRLSLYRPRRARHGGRAALELLELGADEICFGDTIGVGVPDQVADLTERAVAAGLHPRPARLPLPRHPGHGPGQCRRPAWRRVSAASTPRPAAPAAVPTPREPRATWPRRISSTCSMPRAGSTASRSRGCWRRLVRSPPPWAGRSPARSARPAAGIP